MRLTESQLRRIIRSIIKESHDEQYWHKGVQIPYESESDRMKKEEQMALNMKNWDARQRQGVIEKAVKEMMQSGVWSEADAERWLDKHGYSEQNENGNWEFSDVGSKIFDAWEDAKQKWIEDEAKFYMDQEEEYEEGYSDEDEMMAAAERADDIRRYGHDDF